MRGRDGSHGKTRLKKKKSRTVEGRRLAGSGSLGTTLSRNLGATDIGSWASSPPWMQQRIFGIHHGESKKDWTET